MNKSHRSSNIFFKICNIFTRKTEKLEQSQGKKMKRSEQWCFTVKENEYVKEGSDKIAPLKSQNYNT